MEHDGNTQQACPKHAPKTGPMVAHQGRTPDTEDKGKRGEGEEVEERDGRAMYDMRRKVPSSIRCVALNLQIFFF